MKTDPDQQVTTDLPPIVLASASPRRQALLAQIGIRCTVRPVAIDESPRTGEDAATLVVRLAVAKAHACRAALATSDRRPVLAADTVIHCQGQILGKPADRSAALTMLARLSGREHDVLTGVACLGAHGRLDTRLSSNMVRLRPISPDEAARYWHSGEPADKAGAYALQGLGAIFVEGIRGSCSGIIGLPLLETAQLLSGHDIAILGDMNADMPIHPPEQEDRIPHE